MRAFVQQFEKLGSYKYQIFSVNFLKFEGLDF